MSSSTGEFVEVGRFEDCQRRCDNDIKRLNDETSCLREAIDEFRKIIYRSQGVSHVINGLITLATSAAGVALFSYLTHRP